MELNYFKDIWAEEFGQTVRQVMESGICGDFHHRGVLRFGFSAGLIRDQLIRD